MASLKTFLADSKSYLQRIVGLADWQAAPSMSLEQVTTQTRAIMGNMDQFAMPDIHLANAASQIAAIIGESNSLAVPDITLAATKLHVDTSVAANATAHGLTGFAATAQALAATQSPGTTTTVARGDHQHPLDATLWSMAGLNPGANQAIYFSGSNTAAVMPLTAAARALLDDADAPAMRTTLGAQAADPALTALASVTPAADKVPYFTGATTAGTKTVTAAAWTLLDDADATTMRTTLGAAAVNGSQYEGFAADSLVCNQVYVATGSSGGLKVWGVSAVYGFSSATPTVFANGGLAVRNYANSAYAPLNAGAVTYDSAAARSDVRLKRAIVPVARGDGLAQVCRLAATGLIEYRLMAESDAAPIHTGFSAQAVAAAMPCAARPLPVETGAAPLDPPLLGIDTVALLARVVESVAALAERLAALEARP